jgi:hypothetical protein
MAATAVQGLTYAFDEPEPLGRLVFRITAQDLARITRR